MAVAPTVIRKRNTTLAVRFEATPGLDAFAGGQPSPVNDFFKADMTLAFNQQTIANPELTGALDNSASIPGGTKVNLTLTCMAKGSGAPGVAPQWGKLMQLCAYKESLNASVAASALTAGTANTATLGAGYAATAELYQGMPALLTGNPATPTPTVITDYTNGVATIAQNLPAPLDATTMFGIPAHVLYSPVSDQALMKSGTVVIFTDGLEWRFTGCAGSWKLDANSGGTGTLTFTLTGQYTPPVAAVSPTNIVFDAPQPPVWRGGLARLGGQLVRVSKASFDNGGTLFEPENPEAVEGFDPSIITARASKGQFDPLMSVQDTIARIAAFKSGAPQTAAIAFGTQPGNTIVVTSPRTQYTGFTPTARNDVMAETVAFECNAPNAGIFLAVA